MMMMMMMMLRRPSSLRVRAEPRHLPYIYICVEIYVYIYIYIHTRNFNYWCIWCHGLRGWRAGGRSRCAVGTRQGNGWPWPCSATGWMAWYGAMIAVMGGKALGLHHSGGARSQYVLGSYWGRAPAKGPARGLGFKSAARALPALPEAKSAAVTIVSARLAPWVTAWKSVMESCEANKGGHVVCSYEMRKALCICWISTFSLYFQSSFAFVKCFLWECSGAAAPMQDAAHPSWYRRWTKYSNPFYPVQPLRPQSSMLM